MNFSSCRNCVFPLSNKIFPAALWRWAVLIKSVPTGEKGVYSGGGGGGTLPYWRWRGRAAGQGMIFTVIHIDTGYLNRPNWLLAGYSAYHRVASRASAGFPAHNVYDRPAISAPATVRAGPQFVYNRPAISAPATRVRDATDFYERMMIHSRIERPSVPVGLLGMHMKVLVRYIVTGCIFCAPSGLRQGQVFDPQRHPPPPSKWESSAPPPPVGILPNLFGRPTL